MRIADSTMLRVGGEFRQQYQNYSYQNFGQMAANYTDGSPHQLLSRVMIHANLTYKSSFRFFAQTISTARFLNPNPINTQIDQNLFALGQYFVDWKPTKKLTFRVGRQELAYGLERFVATREGPNTRQSFFGFNTLYRNGNTSADLFLTNPISNGIGMLDDTRTSDVLGGFVVNQAIPKHGLIVEPYYWYFESIRRQYAYAKGLEKRHTLGTHIAKVAKKYAIDLELAYQFGDFSGKNINAWMFVWDFSHAIKGPILLGFSGNIVPGDKDRNDQQLNTFNTLFARPPFGQTVALNISNTINLSPYLRFQEKNWLITTRASFVNRSQQADGLYSPNMTQIRPILNEVQNSGQMGVANIYAIDANYIFHKHFFIQFELGFCKSGSYLFDSGPGKDVTYFAVRNAYRF